MIRVIWYECKLNISRTANLHHTGDPKLSNSCFEVTALLEYLSVCSIRVFKHTGLVISSHFICTHCVCVCIYSLIPLNSNSPYETLIYRLQTRPEWMRTMWYRWLQTLQSHLHVTYSSEAQPESEAKRSRIRSAINSLDAAVWFFVHNQSIYRV